MKKEKTKENNVVLDMIMKMLDFLYRHVILRLKYELEFLKYLRKNSEYDVSFSTKRNNS